MNVLRELLLVTVPWIAIAAEAGAGLLVVSGDDTPVFYLTDSFPDPARPGNQRFFLNVLGNGERVVVVASTNGDGDSETHEFYNGVPGVTSTLLGGEVTPEALASVDLLVVIFPDRVFAASEVYVMGQFLVAGWTLCLVAAVEICLVNV